MILKDQENRPLKFFKGLLGVFSYIVSTIKGFSDEGKFFNATTPFLTITATGGKIAYIKNPTTDRKIIIPRIEVSWNGGSATWIKGLFVQVHSETSAPSANNTAGTPLSWNKMVKEILASTIATFNFWDEVSNGMTVSTEGAILYYGIAKQGNNVFKFDDALVIPPGGTIAVNLRGEEIGEASINILMCID